MGNPVVHFEIIGKDAPRLREFYKELFDWEADTDSAVAIEVSEAGNYGFIIASDAASAGGIPGGIGGGASYESHAIFYVGVEDVAQTLAAVERLGGTRVMGPAQKPGGSLVVAHFTDIEGNLIGLAGPK